MKNFLPWIVAIWTLAGGAGASFHSHDNITIMSKCDSHKSDVVAKFTVPIIEAIEMLGLQLTTSDTIRDTGSVIVYIKSLNAYWLTKRTGESVRYDGEIFSYAGHECIERQDVGINQDKELQRMQGLQHEKPPNRGLVRDSLRDEMSENWSEEQPDWLQREP